MKILITGAAGFVASYLIPMLEKSGHQVILSATDKRKLVVDSREYWTLPCDITDAAQVKHMINEIRPDAIVHLAAISHVAEAEKQRALLSAINVVGTHNLCAACDDLSQVYFLYVSTALVYRGDISPLVCSEATPVNPVGAYAQTKLAGEFVVLSFASEKFQPYIVRPFNHIGPGQAPDFVCPSLARRVIACAPGGTIPVGNLDAHRDFTDVRDMVRAYSAILDILPQQRLFTLGKGRTVTIRSVLDTFIKLSGKEIRVEVQKDLLRGADEQIKFADARLAHEVLNWQPEIPLEKTLSDIYHSHK